MYTCHLLIKLASLYCSVTIFPLNNEHMNNDPCQQLYLYIISRCGSAGSETCSPIASSCTLKLLSDNTSSSYSSGDAVILPSSMFFTRL